MVKVTNQIFKYSDGFPIVGWCLYWSIRDVEVNFADLQEILRDCGMDANLAKKPLHRNAFIKSMKDLAKNQKNHFHRKVADEQDKMAMVTVNQNVNDKEYKVKFDTATTAIYEKATKNIEIKGDGGDVINEKFAHHQEHYDSKQLRSLVLKYVKRICRGVTVRKDGGVYFVSTDHEKELERLEEFFGKIKNSVLEVIPIIDSEKARQSVWKSVVGDINVSLDKLLDDFNNLKPDANPKALKIRLKKYENLKSKVEMYESVLKDTADGLKDKIKGINDKVIEKLDSMGE